MQLLFSLIVIFLLNLMSAFFYFKWSNERRRRQEVEHRSELSELIISASLGGYYYWQKQDNAEFFSDNLVSMLNIRLDVRSFSDFLRQFNEDRQIIREAFHSLQTGARAKIRINIRMFIAGSEHHFQCTGHRIEDDKGDVIGVILWFFDVSDYVERLRRITAENHHVKSQMRSYMNVLNSLPFPVWQRDTETYAIKYYNLMYSRFIDNDKIGNMREEVPQLYEGMKEMAKESIRKDKQVAVHKHLVLEGQRRFYQVAEQLVDNKKSILGYAIDITKQEEIEQELSRHISAHADLLESSSSAMAVYGRDTKLKFYNHAFIRMGEFEEKWLSGNPSYTEILESWREKRLLPEQADFKEFREQQLKLFENLITTQEEFFYLPDGKTLRVIVIPHALGGLLFAYEDVTDRLAIERSYNTLIAVQRVILDHVDEGVLLYGGDGILKYYNQRYMQLWPNETAILDKKPHISQILEQSRGLFDVKESWHEFKERIISDLALRSPTSLRVGRTDGKVIDRISIPLPDGDTLVTFIDVTASTLLERSLRERNEALEQADKLKTKFLTNVSYELRTPLTTIMGFTELMLQPKAETLTRSQKEYLGSIYDSSIQLRSLIDDVLDLASIEAGYLTLDVETFDLSKLVRSVLDSLEEVAKRQQVRLVFEGDASLMLQADERRIRQVLFNVINNAIKYSFKHQDVKVSIAWSDAKHVAIMIRDSGVGIPQEEQARVFDKFYTVMHPDNADKAGAGLGLAVVKNIIELHGGEVMLESKQGEGTLVTCVFLAKHG